MPRGIRAFTACTSFGKLVANGRMLNVLGGTASGYSAPHSVVFPYGARPELSHPGWSSEYLGTHLNSASGTAFLASRRSCLHKSSLLYISTTALFLFATINA